MLYYIKSDIVGEFALQVAEGVHVRSVYYNYILLEIIIKMNKSLSF